jgi:hypothetical protein
MLRVNPSEEQLVAELLAMLADADIVELRVRFAQRETSVFRSARVVEGNMRIASEAGKKELSKLLLAYGSLDALELALDRPGS